MSFYSKLNTFSMGMGINGAKIRSMAENIEVLKPEENLPPAVAMVCPTFFQLRTSRDFVSTTAAYCQEAVDQGAKLIAFPEYYGDQCAFCTPFGNHMLEKLMEQIEKEFPKERYLVKMVRETEEYARELYFQTFSVLAKRFGVYILGGSLMTYGENTIKNRSYLFDDKGQVVLTQDKLFLSSWETKGGVTSGEEQYVANTPVGQIMVTSLEGLDYFEPFMVGKYKGAELALLSGIASEQSILKGRIRSNHHQLYLASTGYQENTIPIFNPSQGSTLLTPPLLSKDRDGKIFVADFSPVVAFTLDNLSLSYQFDQYNGDENKDQLKVIWRKQHEDMV